MVVSVLYIGVSFAFFASEIADVINSEVAEKLTFFQEDTSINIYTTLANFGEEDGSKSNPFRLSM